MAETLVNKNQAGEGIWTADNLIAGTDISITQVPQPVIDENTLGVWHFENNLDNAVSGSSYNIASSTQGGFPSFSYSVDKKRFGEYSVTISGSSTNYYLFPTTTPLNSFDSFTIDFWIQTGPSTWGSNYYQRYSIPGLSANQNCVRVEIGSSQVKVLSWTGGTTATQSCTPSTWIHIAIESYQSNIHVYLNGEKISSSQLKYSPLTLAANPLGLSMQLDELRLSNVARYQGNNFNPYTEPYSASSGPTQYAINNTKADPDLSGYLQNTTTQTDSLTIDGTAATGPYAVNIGKSSVARDGGTAIGCGATTSTYLYSTAVGYGAKALNSSAIALSAGQGVPATASGSSSIAIGSYSAASAESSLAVGLMASASGKEAIALGSSNSSATAAKATANKAIQLGSGTNSTANTFKVFNTTVVDANGKIPAANLDTAIPDVSTKADTDLGNVSATGKSTAAGWGMPSDVYEDLTLGASGTTYTAPADGWYFLKIIRDGVNGRIFMETSIYGVKAVPEIDGNAVSAILPVRSGELVTVGYNSYTTATFRFIYAEGSKSEAN